MATYPETLRGRGTLRRWDRNYDAHGWARLPSDVASKFKEVPNHLRPTLGVQKLKGRRSGHFIHDDLQKALDEALVHRIRGPSDVVPLNDSLCVKDRGGACSAGLVQYCKGGQSDGVRRSRMFQMMLINIRNCYYV